MRKENYVTEEEKQMTGFTKKQKQSIEIAMVALTAMFVTGVVVGVGGKGGWDKIFKTIPKRGVANVKNFPCKDGIGFLVYGKNLFGKEIIQAEGYTDIASWVATFIGSMKDPTVGSKVSGLFLKQAPEIQEALLSTASPEVLKQMGISIKQF